MGLLVCPVCLDLVDRSMAAVAVVAVAGEEVLAGKSLCRYPAKTQRGARRHAAWADSTIVDRGEIMASIEVTGT